MTTTSVLHVALLNDATAASLFSSRAHCRRIVVLPDCSYLTSSCRGCPVPAVPLVDASWGGGFSCAPERLQTEQLFDTTAGHA
jgi:hypothetical protein